MLPMKPCRACGFEHPEQVVICPSTQHVIGVAVLGGRYRLDSLIAVGGIGAVYDARALHIDRRVAVKRLLPAYTSDPEVVRRFQREARAAGRIEHPNVVEVLDFGVGEDGVPFLVMEFLEGETLAARIEKSPGQRIPYDELVPIMLDVLEALTHAHSRGIVHRDLKPENIFLAHMANNQTVVKLVDLGISKAIGSTSQAITQSGSALGTPHYMAPEQLRGEKDVDGRVDLYALGIVMYRALSGAFPFDGRTFEHLVTRILDGTCAPLSTVVPGLPAGVSEAVTWAMHKDRDQRAGSAEALAQALAAFAPAPAPVRTSTHPRVPATAAGGRAGGPSTPVRADATTAAAVSTTAPPAAIEPTTTKRPSAAERPAPFRIDSTAEFQASATLPSVAASSSPPKAGSRGWMWLVVVIVLLAGGAVAAYLGLRDNESPRAPEPPATGGLAGSPHADPSQSGSAAAEAGAPHDAAAETVATPLAVDAAPSPAADAASSTAVSDAAAAEAAPPDAADAVRRDAAAVDGRTHASPREAAADAARTDVATPADQSSAVEAEASRPEAGTAQPSVEDVARVFLGVAARVPGCADGEGAGEFRVSARVRGSDGRVRDIEVTTGFSEGARQCVENIVAGLAFPPFGDETASFEHTFTVTGDADAGTGDSGAPSADDIRRRLRRARTRALSCLQGPEGSVTLLVRVDGNAQRATLESIEGEVTADEEACLRGVVEATEVPAYPTVMTVPMRVR